MTLRQKLVVLFIVSTSLLIFGCADSSLTDPESEDNAISDPIESEPEPEPEPEDDSAGETAMSNAEVDGNTGATAVPGTGAFEEIGVTFVTGAEAKEIYAHNDSAILLDVRNQDEFDEMHIAGSILIPVGELETRLSELPDKDAVIIVFCRAGRRSEVASGILTDNGFTNIFDMGAISNWE